MVIIDFILFFLYGLVISILITLSLRKIYLIFIKNKKFNILFSLGIVFIFALLLFIPALFNIKYFIITIISSLTTNTVMMIILYKEVKKWK